MNNSELIWRLEEEFNALTEELKTGFGSPGYVKKIKRREYVRNRISSLYEKNKKMVSPQRPPEPPTKSWVEHVANSKERYVPQKRKPKPRRKVSKRNTYKFKQPAPITDKRYHPKLDSDLHMQYRVDDNYAVSSNVAPAHSLFMSELVMWEEDLLSYEEYLLSEYFDDFDDGRQSWERKWETPVYTDTNQRHNYEQREARAVAKMLDLCDYPLYT